MRLVSALIDYVHNRCARQQRMKSLIGYAALVGVVLAMPAAVAQSSRNEPAVDAVDQATLACTLLAFDPRGNTKRKDLVESCAKAPRDICEDVHFLFKERGVASKALVCVGPR